MDWHGRSATALRSCSKSAGDRMNLGVDSAAGEEMEPKRIKLRDLDSILHSGGCRDSRDEEEHGSSGNGGGYSQPNEQQRCIPVPGSVAALGADQESRSHPSALPEVAERSHDSGFKSSVRLDLDLNVADTSDSMEHNPFFPYRNLSQARQVDPSECGSTTGPLEESEPLRRWREMKQNGFLTSLHGGIPPLPKQRGRPPKRRKEAEQKKKLEESRREQINRFTKVTSPSGLLSGLNPGIINHVRNSKQVHSIIEAIVKSEKAEERDQADGKERETRKVDPPSSRFSFSVPAGKGETRGLEKLRHGYVSSNAPSRGEEDSLALKLTSAGAMPSENASGLSTEDVPANRDSLGSLSLKAAAVASQWLELLYQDTRGRLAALRRSRKRVRYVIQKELPGLLTPEPSGGQENSSCFQQSDASSDSVAAYEHGRRWRTLFDQMETALSEEGKHLERLLDQVEEMQMKCEKGLKLVKDEASLHASSSHKSRQKQGEPLEGEYAVRAAAAALYSACNFILTAENVSCF